MGRVRSRSGVATAVAVLAVAGCSGGSATSPAPVGSPAPSTSNAAPQSQPRMLSAAVAPFRLPATLSRAVAFPAAGGHLLVATGLHDGERSTNAVLDLDPQGKTASVAGRLPTAVHDAAGATLGGTPTVFGGGAAAEVGAIQQFDPARRAARTIGALPVPTSDAVAAAVDQGVLVAGGYDGKHTLSQVLLITSPGHSRALAALPVPVRYPAITVTGTGANQRVLLFGGESGGVATTAVQEIDPGAGTARLVARMPAPRTQAMAVTLGGSIFLAGGAGAGTTGAPVFSDVLRYDPAAHTFMPAGSLPYATSDAAVGVVGQTAYLVGGESPTRTDRSIVLTPAR